MRRSSLALMFLSLILTAPGTGAARNGADVSRAGNGAAAPGIVPTIVPSVTSGPRSASSEVKVLSTSSYKDNVGNLWLVGEVRNDTRQNVEAVKLVASLLDDHGALLDTGFAYAEVSILRPSQRAPFGIVVVDPPARYHHSTLQVAWSTTTDQPPAGVTLLSSTTRPSAVPSWRYIVGEVRNTSGGPVEQVTIVATMYNANGTVVAVASGSPDVDDLPAGQTSRFDILVSPWLNVARYELQVQAVRP